MTEATPPTNAPQDPAPDDPTVESLLPARSTRRNVALVAAGIAVLAAAWWSADVLRPSLVAGDTLSGVAFSDRDTFVTVVQVHGRGWPWVEVVDVPGIPGATPVEVHLAPGSLADPIVASEVVRLGPGDAGTGMHGRLGPGQSGTMTILWEITDCGALTREPFKSTSVIVRSGLGLQTEETLPSWAAPADHVEILTEDGFC